MFSKIQNHLLLHQPLLWNMKIVPVAAISLALHLIFFLTGYINGAVDFTQAYEQYVYDVTPGIAIFFSVIIGLFLFIIWIVYYFRNNAFKAFYPKNKSSLYKEWLLIILVCLLNCTYSLTFMYAQDLRKRNYFPEQEFSHRVDVISMASVFVDGGFLEDEYYQEYDKQLDSTIQKHRTTFPYFGKEYPLKSLLNKANSNFTYQDHIKDSVNAVRVKGWLHNNQRDSVAWLLHQMDDIVKSHQLKSGITPHEWLTRVYNPPLYSDYTTIGRVERYELTDYRGRPTNTRTYDEYSEEAELAGAYAEPDTAGAVEGKYYVYSEGNQRYAVDLTENNVRTINEVIYVYPKYYVPFSQLEEAYGKISNAWVNPDINLSVCTIYFCCSIMLSLVIFSFRVTSGRSWLIALIVYGLTALVVGIICMILGVGDFINGSMAGYLYFIFWIIIVVCLLIYFYSKKESKGISGIVVNILLWLTPALLPTIIFLIKTWYDDWYYDTYYRNDGVYLSDEVMPVNNGLYPDQVTPPKNALIALISDYPHYTFLLCAFVFIGYMYFFTNSIRKWKGVAEA